MLPLAYLDIPTRLWLADELFDDIYQSSSHLRDARPAACIDKAMKILVREDSGLAHKLVSYILLAAAHEDPENVYVSINETLHQKLADHRRPSATKPTGSSKKWSPTCSTNKRPKTN